ncbi:uncharacterized protein K489DRAFT_403312 [Dissoconium aciculare CBS 342.82]|uniref:Uncharacterized protein n=1 Tax=Dissoconium aciculare CBS 342.82 TaxID=1314786 RepID=A0A6J3LY81_9PEZI|nr:uncharacterized protein K489DRAFT_403312 [Dissoconium aciculare CBS 342.82]KAF1820721.1 hypothetical protein K489DRAFT_403312 [Dissoconium aciculare CBS 342.82]
MKTSALQLLSTLALLLATVWAEPSDDLRNLTNSCLNVADSLTLSLNDTSAKNTSDLVQYVMYEVGASMANLGCDTSTQHVPRMNITNTTSVAEFDDTYLDYAASLGELSHAVIARGRIFHQEMNLPVVVALQGLASAVYYYGRCLRNGNFISQGATIRTWTAGSDIVEAQTAWDKNLNYPGRRRRARRANDRK